MQRPLDPKNIYETLQAARMEDVERLSRRDDLFANARTALFVGGIVLVALTSIGSPIRGWWLALPFLGFLVCVVMHDGVLRAKARATKAVEFYAKGLARLGGRWKGLGCQATHFADADHPYAQDLDLFGEGSLFDLMCTARTQAGEHRLAEWLLSPGQVSDIQQRHQAIADLLERTQLREDMALLGFDVRQTVRPEAILRWAKALPQFGSMTLALVAAVVALTNVLWLVAWGLGKTSPLPFVASLVLTAVLKRPFAQRVSAVTSALSDPGRELLVLAKVAARFSQEDFQCAHVRQLQHILAASDVSAARCIKRLDRLVVGSDAYRNQAFWPIGFTLLWDLQFALQIEKWRLTYGHRIQEWLHAVAELEALLALAGYTFEHPDHVFPDVVDQAEPVFEGVQLGHPLLASHACVRNDVVLTPPLQALVVSGSNMSGKSTLLRTVGINTVLALAGAPVCAQKLKLVGFSVGATLRVQDSLMAGNSRFYAEISRIKSILDLTRKSRPVLFLLDEILHGTNSHDRRIGAMAIIKSLLDHGAMGLVTTHDLALTDGVSELNARAVNVHFEDELQNGKLVFDFTMRPGVVQRSNAIALMQAVGLDLNVR